MDDQYTSARAAMVKWQIRARGIQDERILEAMERIPRHEFVPKEAQNDAYRDGALSINGDQTISQPYIVALMTQALHLRGDEHVLEIGTGSGYQTAVLCEMAQYVYSLERVARLARDAVTRLHGFGYANFDVHVGDGSQGLADMAPFDAILVTAAAPSIPKPLQAQMSPNGGRMVIPIGGENKGQFLELITRHDDHWYMKHIAAVHFVPLLGRFGF